MVGGVPEDILQGPVQCRVQRYRGLEGHQVEIVPGPIDQFLGRGVGQCYLFQRVHQLLGLGFAQRQQLGKVHFQVKHRLQPPHDVIEGAVVAADAHRVVVGGQERVHGGHGAQAQHLQISVIIVGDGYQGHGDGGSVAALGAVIGVTQAEPVQVLLHVGPAVDATDTAFHLGRRGAVVPFDRHNLGGPQLRDRLEECFGVHIDAEPGLLAEEDDQTVSGVVEPVAPGHGLCGKTFIVGHSGAVGVVGAGHLEWVAELGDFRAHLADLDRA